MSVIGQNFTRLPSRRRFGVELEVTGCDGYMQHGTPFSYKSDCSVNGAGKEFVSPILQGDEGLEAVESLCAYAASHDWQVDSSCGYHLHIDLMDLDDHERKRIYYAYALTQSMWAKLVPARRVSCSYCRPLYNSAADIRAMTWEDCQDSADDRYVWCNICSFYSHGTLEIRHHQGTIEAPRVVNWIQAHLRFVDIVRAMTLEQLDARFKGKSIEETFAEVSAIWGDRDLSRFYARKLAYHCRRAAARATA